MNEVFFDDISQSYLFECPHCNCMIQVGKNEINCHIFRHGYYYQKNGNDVILTNQVYPHLTKDMCDQLVNENKIIGCGKPFRMVKKDKYFVEICDYI